MQNEPVIYEILIVEFINMGMLIYQGYFRPAYSLFENRVEFLNEFNVSVCSTLVMCFTEWQQSEDLKFLIGWGFCCLILFQILINLTIILYYSFRSSSLVVRFGVNRTVVRCFRKLFKKEEPEPLPKFDLHPIEIRRFDLMEKKKRL